MNSLVRFTLLFSAFSGKAYATQWEVVGGENMVMLPPVNIAQPSPEPTAPLLAPTPAPVAVEENMVMIPVDAPVKEGKDVFVPITGPSYVEAGINMYNVSNGQGDWQGQFINGQVQTDPKNRWNAQVQHQEAFHDNGSFVGIGNTHTFDEDWFSDVGVGVGSNTSFFPHYRVDASANRKLLPEGNMIATLGTTYMKANRIYTSYGLFGGISYYFATSWNMQMGIRSDRSTPGGVYATSGFGALTYGRQKQHYLTGRVGYGREAYQLLGLNPITNAFNSHTLGLNWRQWIGESWGYNLGGEYYRNPTYHRTGGTLSFFKEF